MNTLKELVGARGMSNAPMCEDIETRISREQKNIDRYKENLDALRDILVFLDKIGYDYDYRISQVYSGETTQLLRCRDRLENLIKQQEGGNN